MMHPIHSGTSIGRIVRSALLLILTAGFSAAYLYDGYIGYTRQNAAEFAATHGLTATPPVNSKITAELAGVVIGRTRAGDEVSSITAEFGQHSARKDDVLFFLGPAGGLVVTVEGDRVRHTEWSGAKHSETDLRWQVRIGWVLAVVAVVLAGHMVRVLLTRASLTEDGLKLPGRGNIPFDEMAALEADDFRRTGRATLVVESIATKRRVELDAYFIRELPAILEAIVKRKGFGEPGSSSGEPRT